MESKLDAASPFLRTLQLHGTQEVVTHTLGCELATRKKRCAEIVVAIVSQARLL